MVSFLTELTISVIIPVHNGGENFRRCLTSLAKAVPPANEIIVVLDGDTDGSWKLAEGFGARVMRTPVRGGPARARNLGARLALGDIVLFLDADVAISADAIGQIEMAFRRQPDLAAVFGSYDDEPAENNFISLYKNLFHHYIHQTSREEASTFWGACGAIRREIFFSIGVFNEYFHQPSIEDIELGYRLKKAGHRIWLCKNLQVKHLKRWDVFSLLKSDFFHRAIPWTELILQDRWLINDLNLRTSNRISVILTYGLIIALIGIRRWSLSPVVIGLLILLLLMFNLPLYRFFKKKCGLWFTVKTIPWHWLYYFYSGLAFMIGIIRYISRRLRFFKLSLPKASKI